MRPVLIALLAGACFLGPAGPVGAAPGPRPTPAGTPAPVVSSPVADLIADLGDVDPKVRETATLKLGKVPRPTLISTAVDLVSGRARASKNDDRMFSPAAVALDLLVRIDPRRADVLALEQVETRDPDVRDTAAAIVARLGDASALPFLTRALREWGVDNTAGLHAVALGLDPPARADNVETRAAVISVLMKQPLPARNPKFTYSSEHEPPQDGDHYRCWLFKADACLGLIARHPFPEANDGIRRCLLLDELRIGAALALAQLKQPDTAQILRGWLDKDSNTEHRLGLYRALFIVGGDTDKDRLAARDTFTATQAPSSAWVEGLRAMVDLFSARADEPALRVVATWKLRGGAATLRKGALDAMKAAHPDVYEKLLGKDFVPPGDKPK